ncbi:hypothetical protein BCR32DRAFT_240800 [Anaeromyces robustus]|uniref:Uncharacterized protein n=1 Tax=Anaeromyces robustus TaxID=1754192 RepID=A0A1Y1XMB5_9FUNG|nr:hypothetical protein BCR32DRAFT_240800 [Anaeromyces robustus]|eukprot:ORX86656.1 hypothetical protein BCR32DRAFT_240800 [Anaeromyces robustus]
MNENDLNVVASFTKRVEDLHSGKKRSHRIRRIRHRAQKRSRKNKSSLQKQNLEIVEQTIEQKPIEVIEDISVTENNISKTELVIPPIPKVESINKTNIEKTDVVKEKSMKIEKKINELSKVRNSLPLVDLCRDRRRRISSIKRSSTENITRNDIAKALKPNYSVQKTALKQSFMPTWAKFSLSWV